MNFLYLLNKSDIVPSSTNQNDFVVEGLAYDSKKVKKNFIFFAIKGYKDDGNKYVESAISNGAEAIITDSSSFNNLREKFSNVNVIGVEDVRETMAMMSSVFYDYPSRKLNLIGVTGTNGKTTITYLLKKIFEDAGLRCGLIGTIDYMTGEKTEASRLTTPDSIEINKMLSDMVNSGIQYCFMEVSSIALVLKRVYNLRFIAGVFTNLTSEHLDLHENMENYFQAKKILFDNLSEECVAISNKDDNYGFRILENTVAKKIFYSMQKEADYRAVDENVSMEGLDFILKTQKRDFKIKSNITGRFNIYNILAAVSVADQFKIKSETIVSAISKFVPVNGRFNKILLPNKAYAVIDYSHTSDSLKNAIEAAIEINGMQGNRGRVITIFGCGGNKDKTKRPVMGNISTSLSSYSIVTSDNPRFEEPMDIINEVISGIKTKGNYEIEVNREKAISRGIEISKANDIILICGKGHETYQEVKGVKFHFDDKEMVEKYFHLAK
jgi:UDP-N-acetylmuramoyl-L-alanyl-D-glutamate--2,6-diaminopimelate ligase